MPRPRKCRMVGFLPAETYFKPAGIPLCELSEVILTHEELEALRLKDLEALEQTDCALRMQVSRPTFQRILYAARSKVAEALVTGKAIHIEGGDFQYCHGMPAVPSAPNKDEEGKTMKIALPEYNGEVNPHFGQSRSFAIVEVENGTIKDVQSLSAANLQHQHEGLAGILREAGVSVVIVGGIGPGAIQALEAQGFEVISGATGGIRQVVEAYLAGNLVSTGAVCGHHHGHGHHH